MATRDQPGNGWTVVLHGQETETADRRGTMTDAG
jgi:hypothetical protein